MTDVRELDLSPSDEFAARLEEALLRDLFDSETGASARSPMIEIRSVQGVRSNSATGRSRLIIILATAAAVIALVASAVWSTSGSIRPTNTVTPTSSVTTSSPVEYLPMPPANDEVAAGDYAVSRFAVPFTIRTTGIWIHVRNWLNVFSLLRLTGPELAVTSGVFEGATPAEVIANFCPLSLDVSHPVDTLLLDQPALQVTARATAACALPIGLGTESNVSPSDIIQITAASVDGVVVVVVVGALWPQWPALESEIADLLSSMHQIN